MKQNTHRLTRNLVVAAVAVASLGLVRSLVASNPSPRPPGKPATAPSAQVQRGEYLARFGGCADCHTPKKMGPMGPVDDDTRMFSGHPESMKVSAPPANPGSPWMASTAGMTAWAGPWGITYAANLTPDANTGLGIWSEEMFIKAMRTGKHMGEGRPILPPMPWQAVGALTDSDLRALFAYLKSLPAIRNNVPAPVSPDGHVYE